VLVAQQNVTFLDIISTCYMRFFTRNQRRAFFACFRKRVKHMAEQSRTYNSSMTKQICNGNVIIRTIRAGLLKIGISHGYVFIIYPMWY